MSEPTTTPATTAPTTFTTGPFTYTCAYPVAPIIAELAWHLADLLATDSDHDPDSAWADHHTTLGTLKALPYRNGRIHPSKAWTPDATWAVLIIYPGSIEGEHPTDPTETYIFPRHLFTQWAAGADNTFALVDYIPGEFPGVLSVDLTEHAYRNRHTIYGPYRITRNATDTPDATDATPTPHLDTTNPH